MKKEEQKSINEKCALAYADFMRIDETVLSTIRLRTCQAVVVKTPNYIFLRSYNTVVAFIDLNTDEFYDVLRMVYGYTSTSSQHIAKFKHDYRNYWIDEYRYYDI